MSLKARIALSMAVVVAVVGIASATAAYWSARNEFRASNDAFLVQRAEAVSQPVQDALTRFGASPPRGTRRGDRRFPAPSAGDRLFNDLDATTQLIDPGGDVLLGLEDAALPVGNADSRIAESGAGQLLRDVDVDGEAHRMITSGLPDVGAIQIARSTAEDEALLRALRNRLLLAALAAVGVAGLMGWIIAERVTRPVESLRDAAHRVAETQDLSTTIDVHGDDEVGDLAESFNTMLVALAGSREQQRQLVQDASHELRTPLTSVRTGIELLARDDLSEADRSRLLANLHSESAELTALVSELVELATDRSNVDEETVHTDLAALLDGVVERSRQRFDRDVSLTLEDATAGAPLLVEVRPHEVERAVANLVDNAVKYSPEGSPVEIALSRRPGGVSIAVSDHGPGIPPEEAGRVFDRFYRTDSARALPGSGLGLAIVKQIAENHGGSVIVDSGTSGGATVVMFLPAAD